MVSKYLKEFEELNTTTDSIYDLGDYEVLIILKDGTNLTNWDDMDKKNDVKYISEDLSKCTDLYEKYKGFRSVKSIVARNVTSEVRDLDGMFHGCYALVDIVGMDSWDTSNVTYMYVL